MEYDCQISYNVFGGGTQKADSAFSPANTDVWVNYSEEGLTDSIVNWPKVTAYMSWHWELISGPVELGYPKLRYSSYMMAMQDATEKPSDEGEEILGCTFSPGACGYTCAVIFVQAIKNSFPEDQNMIDYVPIHEMGHMRGTLTHLCDEYGMMRSEHNDSSCVMGQDKFAICTGKDVSANPHFCPMCIEKLKQVLWEWP